MPDPYRLVTPPTPVLGPLGVAGLAGVVAVDALLRRARAQGRPTEWAAAALGGDLAGQRAVERQLARQGLDRGSAGRRVFARTARTFGVETEGSARRQLEMLGVDMPGRPARTGDQEWVTAARTAFVRLYESGLLRLVESVAPECPSCQTVLDSLDCEPIELDDPQLRVRLPYDDGAGDLEVEVSAPELLPGVVAAVVPTGHEGAGRRVDVPLGRDGVPVIEERARRRPGLLVPAHAPDDLELARRVGLVPVEVVDGEGVVRLPGPLEGLRRFAARSAAHELLAAGDSLGSVGRRGVAERRCLRCGTVVVPRMSMRWWLDLPALEEPVAELVGDGVIRIADPVARARLLERAGRSGPWCLSHQVWEGQSVPVAHCADCAGVQVAVDIGPSCGRCMGPVVADTDVLDARFVGALWALVSSGWPADAEGAAARAPFTTLVVDGPAVTGWALPMAALGVALAGSACFAAVAVQPLHGLSDTDTSAPVDLDALVQEGRATARVAVAWSSLTGGRIDVDAARRLVHDLSDPKPGDGPVDGLAAAVDDAFDGGCPALALPSLAAAVETGVRRADVARVQSLAAPLLGS